MSLPVSNLVRIAINLGVPSAGTRSFGTLCISGDSDVINPVERLRSYITLEGVALDFGTSAPEYLGAAKYFGQVPKPRSLTIGRWLRTASAGENLGGLLTPTEQLISNWTAITSGGLVIVIDGVTKTLTGLDFSGQTNLNGVASVITTALSTSGVCTWDGSAFKIRSATTGLSSNVGYATTGSVSPLVKLTSGTNVALIPGFAAETPVQNAAVLANKSAGWYGLTYAASTQPTDDQNIAVCDFVEALDLKRMFGVTITNSNVLSAVVTSDLASRMMDGAYRQSFNQYSSESAYAICSLFGRIFSVNFNANRSTITAMYKQEPTIVAEDLEINQALVLKSKRCNVFVDYVNDTSIIQYGVMSGNAWIDEVHGLDWLQDDMQTSCYNAMYTSKTKIPQTDAGENVFVNALDSCCGRAVNNGLVAPGVWNEEGFGQLEQGQYLKTGYYIYAQPMALQSQSDRDVRLGTPIQVAVKLAGAIQELDVLVNVNR